MSDTREALELLKNKEFEKAYKAYKNSFATKDYKKDEWHYRNINNILISIHFYYIKTKEEFLFEEFTQYFQEYIKIAKNCKTITWANNIVEDLLEYAFEVAMIHFTENNTEFSMQQEKLQEWTDENIFSFIQCLHIVDARDYSFFYDVILRIIFKERANFERNGNEYQNIVNTKFLGKYFLKLTGKERSLYKRSRSNVYQLFSELIYNDPEQKGQEYFFLTRNAVEFLEKSLDEFPSNLFAKKRRHQLSDSLTIQEQLHRFDHDVSSKISTLNSLIRRLKRKAKELNEPKRMERIIDDISVILNLSREEVPELEDVDILDIFNEITEINNFGQLNIKIESKGEKRCWMLNQGYFKVIFENICQATIIFTTQRQLKIPL